MPSFTFNKNRAFGVICLGRVGIDLYATEHNTDFHQVNSFQRYIGGSPGNIAVSLSRLGVKTGLISCLSEDGLGKTVRDYLYQKGIHLDGVQTAPQHCRTSLAVTEMKPSNGEVVLYRNDAADLFLQPDAIQQDYIASAQCLLISGTALSASPSREAAFIAMQYAKNAGTRIILDIDFRAYSWASTLVASLYYQLAIALADIVIGNEEEIQILTQLGEHTIETLFSLGSTSIMVIKKGEHGSETLYQSEDKTHIKTLTQPIFPVNVIKPFGAGDAFAGALIFGLLNDYSLAESLQFGAAAAAINVSQNNCSEAMPNFSQLNDFIQNWQPQTQY